MAFRTYEDHSSMEFTPENHVAIIVIAAVVGLVWSILMIIMRIYLRLRLIPPLGVDDAVAVFGTIAGVVQTSVTLHAVHNGIGKQEDLLAPDDSIYIAWLLYPIAICSSKVSLALLIARLTVVKMELRASHALGGIGVLWGVVSVIVAATQCKLPQPWNIGASHQCDSMFVRWTVVEAGNMLIELLIPGLIIMVLWNLQARLKAKLTVLLAFSVQLLVAIPTIFRLLLLQEMTTEDIRSDRTFALTNTVVLTEITMHFSLMAATFPCLRKFLQAFDTHLGATTHMTTDLDDTDNTGSKGSYVLRSLEHPSQGTGSSFEQWPRHSRRPGRKYQPHTVTTISAGSDSNPQAHGADGGKKEHMGNQDIESGSVESDDSQFAMIRRTQHWEVTIESRGK
ncbi:hypothetical protein ANOM_006709 [Aspergillus nomiae NRRL 13137]|uniref:Rhodopsin domain-containing protein n=1 Tax=Aspergillus nomiae NRRL (strain ATCC 15546 / NRRL 13137 / CBS 260.88 / M93) TaxID=1509407 RepID=A0A0L1IZ25_ASPN3|nr:uncharacterized protein ANOM_006709 [Aspergillus nomiae NRRL 13137]KNG84806.1 hypothetical protein ANOM_006709 [Aspergillus nomiae NRRL 13137]